MKQLVVLLSLLFWSISSAQYTTTQIITGINYPVAFEIAPDGRYFVTLKGGTGFAAPQNAQVNIYSSTGALNGVLWDFTDSVETYFERGVLGIALDPDFSANHYVYVFVNQSSPNLIRVYRFTENSNSGSNPTVIFEYQDPFSAGNHTGGNIHFRPSEPDKLYISIGDRAVQANAQLLSNPCGKILRIGKDGSIPTDNPFYDDGNPSVGNDDRIWAYGLRNSFDFCFSPVNDSLYASENGLNTWDEVNQIHKGANYGWPTCEGFFLQGSTTNACNNSSYTAPMDDWGAPLPAVTGIMLYNSSLMPEFTGHLFVGDYDNGDITDFTLSGTGLDQVSARQTAPFNFNGIVDLAEGPEGCLYVLEGGYSSNGKITRVCPTGMGIHNPGNLEGAISVSPGHLLNISLSESGTFHVDILDLSGRRVLETIFSGNNTVITIPQASSGILLIKVYQPETGKQLTGRVFISE